MTPPVTTIAAACLAPERAADKGLLHHSCFKEKWMSMPQKYGLAAEVAKGSAALEDTC